MLTAGKLSRGEADDRNKQAPYAACGGFGIQFGLAMYAVIVYSEYKCNSLSYGI
jgi:hypothetical protein